jgi:hypothetical protein
MKKKILTSLGFLVMMTANAQTLVNNGATLSIKSGTTLIVKGAFENKNSGTLDNNGVIQLSGDFTNSASLSGSGNIEFNGTSSQNIISGGATIAQLDVNKGSSQLVLGDDVTVSSLVDLTGSANFIQLGNYNLTLQSGASITGTSSSSYIVTNGTGMLHFQNVGASNTVYPIGTSTSSYTPATINNAGTADQLGMRVSDEVYTTYNGSGNGSGGILSPADEVKKSWIINEAVAGGSNLALTLQWNASDEGASFARNNAAIAYYNGGWQLNNVGSAASGSNPYTLSRSGLTNTLANTPFGVGSGASPLPLRWLSYQVTLMNTDGHINWATVSESGVSHYILERSTDGIHYTELAKIKSQENIYSTNNYLWCDKNVAELASQHIYQLYYHLIQVEADGSRIDAGVRIIHLNAGRVTPSAISKVSLFPNPFQQHVSVSFDLDKAQMVSVLVADINGKNIMNEKYQGRVGNNQLLLSDENLASGIYMLHLSVGNEVIIYKMVKQ